MLFGIGQLAETDDDLRCALGDTEMAAVARDFGFGPFPDGIERMKGLGAIGCKRFLIRRPGKDRRVDRIGSILVRGECGRQEETGTVSTRCRPRLAQCELILGQSAGLVCAEHVHAGHFLDRDKTRDDSFHPCQAHGAHGHGDREHGGKRNRDRRDGQDEGEFSGLSQGVAAKERCDSDNGDESTVTRIRKLPIRSTAR